MRSKASALLPGIAMATRLPSSRQALNTVTFLPPLPNRENPASARNPRMHESSAVPPLPPIGSSRLPVNSDSSQRALPAVLLPTMHCAYVVTRCRESGCEGGYGYGQVLRLAQGRLVDQARWRGRGCVYQWQRLALHRAVVWQAHGVPNGPSTRGYLCVAYQTVQPR